jgi:hypothetical protein
VERIDETGVWVAGVHYALDCLIFASGFEVGTGYAGAGFETTGRDGLTLSEHWVDGMQQPARHARARLPQPVHRRAQPRAPT